MHSYLHAQASARKWGGEPEDYLPIHEGVSEGYLVCRRGFVLSFKRYPDGRRLRPVVKENGYHYHTLQMLDGTQKGFTIHRLVAAAFIGPRPAGLDILHLDHDKSNNDVSNLRYGTRSENEIGKIEPGVSNRGSRNGRSLLTEGQVMEIWKMLSEGRSTRQIAEMFGVRPGTIESIQSGANWSWLTRRSERAVS